MHLARLYDKLRPSSPHSGYDFFPKTVRDVTGDVFSGMIVALMNVAVAMGFAAILFKNGLQSGYAIGLWSILVTTMLVGLVVGCLTAMPPLTGSPDTAVIAAMGFLSAEIAAPLLDRGIAATTVVQTVMMSFTIVAITSGVIFLAIGWFRLGQALRFVPYPLISGFLASTGILLMLSAYATVSGQAFQLGNLVSVAPIAAKFKIFAMVAIAVALWTLPKIVRSPLTTPIASVTIMVSLNVVLANTPAAEAASWYLSGTGSFAPWSPFSPTTLNAVDWGAMVDAIPNIAACVFVGLISLIVKISSMETRRTEIADVNYELRVNGIASFVSGPAGGVAGMLAPGASEMFADSGARTRMAAVVATVAIGAIVVLKVDLAALVPTPLIGGMLLRSGFNTASDALRRTFRQRSALDVVLVIAIAFSCVKFGYDAGILVGFIAASLIFAFNYGRIGVIRRHVTRASINVGVERAPEIERLLRQHGDAIHLYALSGYVFFGSAEALFEQIRSTVESQTSTAVQFVLLDFSAVMGMDSSAVGALSKLYVLASRRRMSVAFINIAASLQSKLSTIRVPGSDAGARVFATSIDAFSWCEERLLKSVAPVTASVERVDIEAWLSSELGYDVTRHVIETYFQRQAIEAETTIYSQGGRADTIDFIESGILSLNVVDATGHMKPIRLLTHRTVVGEMGFFRGASRSASISAKTPSTLYTLSFENMNRLQRDVPELYAAMLTFFIRTLADRVEHAHREIAILRS